MIRPLSTRSLVGVFILDTQVMTRLDDISFNASFSSSFNSPCIKKDERRIMRLHEVKRSVRL